MTEIYDWILEVLLRRNRDKYGRIELDEKTTYVKHTIMDLWMIAEQEGKMFETKALLDAVKQLHQEYLVEAEIPMFFDGSEPGRATITLKGAQYYFEKHRVIR